MTDPTEEGRPELNSDHTVEIPLEDYLDLHTFLPKDIPDVVVEYLRACAEKGWREVRLIHGKGTGFQRRRVREVLRQLPSVEWFGDAPAERGHWGATVVVLKLAEDNSPG